MIKPPPVSWSIARWTVFLALATSLGSSLEARAPTQTAVLAGGCFWGMEGVFEHVRGVQKVVSGYAGGSVQDANYEAVSSERTGHAEAIMIKFDPSKVSYSQLLSIFFTVAHDPTEVDRQGPDVGRSYRSAIFPLNAQQRSQALRSIAEFARSREGHAKIATRIESGHFYPAEPVHQGFLARHPDNPYIVVNDLPKLVRLKSSYPGLWTSY